ncbi:dienelactone hydrolase family protein [Chitinilyticum litopenaei]|uniref:dienelactone hydrolase family protein n=1 Tax=Chitinilyticum litopenaei TaxID=1121276 RepID=UPI000421619C|nr:CocE/NonD family hydrolase [Chitinilyticum litopenaei]
MKNTGWIIGMVLALSSACMAGEELPLRKDLNESVEMIRVKPGIFGFALETTLFKPDGPGPFPLVVINHGKEFGLPAHQPRSRYSLIAQEFLQRGYAVALPMRRGFANSGGMFPDGSCQNLAPIAEQQADDIERVIAYFRQQPDIDAERILVIGQSAGGFTSMALASREIAGVKAVLNFAGGLRFTSLECNWESALKNVFAGLGKRARVDSMWFYAENDSLFPPELARSLHATYREGGGKAELVLYPPFRQDGHGMFGTREGLEQIWWPKVEAFLQARGLPTKVLGARYRDLPVPPPSGHAESAKDFNAFPLSSEQCKNLYRQFVATAPLPRAFAVSDDGACGAWADYEEPAPRALQYCRQYAKRDCHLYLVNDTVVWPVQN